MRAETGGSTKVAGNSIEIVATGPFDANQRKLAAAEKLKVKP